MTDEMKYEKILEVNGRMKAEIIESYLEAQGIDVELVQESVGHSSIPITVDGFGRVQIFVPKEKIQEAREFLKSYEEGTEEE